MLLETYHAESPNEISSDAQSLGEVIPEPASAILPSQSVMRIDNLVPAQTALVTGSARWTELESQPGRDQ